MSAVCSFAFTSRTPEAPQLCGEPLKEIRGEATTTPSNTPRESTMKRITEFLAVYRQYRLGHSPAYAARIAWGVAFQGLPF